MSWLKRLANAFGLLRQECAIVIVGLDNSGKTTLINHIKPKKVRPGHCWLIYNVGSYHRLIHDHLFYVYSIQSTRVDQVQDHQQQVLIAFQRLHQPLASRWNNSQEIISDLLSLICQVKVDIVIYGRSIMLMYR